MYNIVANFFQSWSGIANFGLNLIIPYDFEHNEESEKEKINIVYWWMASYDPDNKKDKTN